MWDDILTGTLLAIVGGLIGWVAKGLWERWGDKRDRKKVYDWLHANTRDEPGESHVGTIELAKGTRLTEERVRKACMSDPKIYRSSGDPEQWSIWRQEPQSVYEKRGLLTL